MKENKIKAIEDLRDLVSEEIENCYYEIKNNDSETMRKVYKSVLARTRRKLKRIDKKIENGYTTAVMAKIGRRVIRFA